MPMPLEEALEAVTTHAAEVVVEHAELKEALGVVLEAAKERFAARTVEETNAATARALEAARSEEDPLAVRHLYIGRSGGGCYLCHNSRGHELHQPLEAAR